MVYKHQEVNARDVNYVYREGNVTTSFNVRCKGLIRYDNAPLTSEDVLASGEPQPTVNMWFMTVWMACQVLVLYSHPSAAPTLMLVFDFLPLVDASPGLQSLRNRLKAATQRISLLTHLKLMSMHLPFSPCCVTTKGVSCLFANGLRSTLLKCKRSCKLKYISIMSFMLWLQRSILNVNDHSSDLHMELRHTGWVKYHSLLETRSNKVSSVCWGWGRGWRALFKNRKDTRGLALRPANGSEFEAEVPLVWGCYHFWQMAWEEFGRAKFIIGPQVEQQLNTICLAGCWD